MKKRTTSNTQAPAEGAAAPTLPVVTIPAGEDPARPRVLVINGVETPIEAIRDTLLQEGIRTGRVDLESTLVYAESLGISRDYMTELMSQSGGSPVEEAPAQGRPTDRARPLRRGPPEPLDDDDDDEEEEEEEAAALNAAEVLDLLPDAVYEILRERGLYGPGVGVRFTILVDDRPEVAVGAEIVYADAAALRAYEAHGVAIPPASMVCASAEGSAVHALLDAVSSAHERARAQQSKGRTGRSRR